MAKRRNWTKAQRATLYEAHEGLCHICGNLIDLDADRMEVEHLIPLALGGADEWANIRPAHATCHAAKTKSDVTSIAKAKRVHLKHTGQFRPPRRIVPGSKASRFKKCLNGKVVLRHERGPANV
jgi:5-methylcytosine-specific restriction enzyme A